jgi:TusA-related sulfurtransferase
MPSSRTGRTFHHALDCKYMNCNGVIACLDQKIHQISNMEIIMLETTDVHTPNAIPAYCQVTQNKYLPPLEHVPDPYNPNYIIFTHFIKKL